MKPNASSGVNEVGWIGAGLVGTVWIGVAIFTLIAVYAEWSHAFRRGMEEATEELIHGNFEPGSFQAFQQMLMEMDAYWAGKDLYAPTPESVRTAPRTKPPHHLGIPLVLAIHLCAFGSSYVSLSLVHVTLPLGFWVAAAVSSLTAVAGIPWIMVQVYALAHGEEREYGESASDFLVRKMMEGEEREGSWMR